MRISNVAGYALSTSIALTSLAGCGGGSQMAPTPVTQSGAWSPSTQGPALQHNRPNSFLAMHGGIVPGPGVTRPSFVDPRALRKALVFVSYGGNVDIYLQGGTNKMVGQITGPSGLDLATDTAGDLYSVNFSSSNVTIYAPPYTNGPKLTLPAGRDPVGVAVSRQGTVAVTTCTILNGSQCGQGVLFYAAGSTTPCATVLVDASTFSGGLVYAAFDRKGNLYVDGSNSSTNAAVFGKIDGGCDAQKAKALTTTNTIAYAGSIKIDKAGRIAILAAVGTYPYTTVIDTYGPPTKGSLGSPVSTTPLPGTTSSYSGTFAFRTSGLSLWAGREGLGSSYAAGASEFAYPAGGTPEKTIMGTPESFTYGVAVTPALVP